MIYIFAFVWLFSAIFAIKLNPQLAFILFCMALVLVIIGAILESIERIKQAKYESYKTYKPAPDTLINNYYSDDILKGDHKDENESVDQ